MALRFRKSISLGKGVRLNVGKRGAGISVGPRGARYSVHSSGRRTASVGVPGSGLSYSASSGGGRRGSRAQAPPPPPPPKPPKPGLLAPGYEKAFYRGILAYAEGRHDDALERFQEAADKDSKQKAACDDFMAAMALIRAERVQEAIPHLEAVVRADDPLPDELMEKYIASAQVSISITTGVAIMLPFGSLAAALLLVEAYELEARLDEAIGLLQQLIDEDAPDPAIRLSLCDLYAEQESWDEIIELAAKVGNEDDIGCATATLYGRALAGKGLYDGALQALKEALRSSKRDDVVLTEARYQRALVYEQKGDRRRARQELERVYASDPDYADVAARLSPPAPPPR